MIILLGLMLILGVMSYFVDECPTFNSYYVNGEYDCDYVMTYGEGCYELDVDNECVEGTCMYGYYWEGEYCEQCSDVDAMVCDDEGVSVNCWYGYWLDETNTCQPCTTYNANCNLCDETQCFMCDEGMALYDNECVYCDCDVYIDGCDDYAISCDYNGLEITVIECHEGYFLTYYDSAYPWCLSCGDVNYDGFDNNAASCVFDDGPIVVTSCEPGFCMYEDGEYYQCYNVGHPVLDCTFDSEYYSYSATECYSGYETCQETGMEDNECYECGSYYYTINTCTFVDDGDCSTVDTFECNYGFVSTEPYGKGCISCPSDCAVCEYFDGELGEYLSTCDECVATDSWEVGFYRISDVYGEYYCVNCGSNCAECVDYNECTTCISVLGIESCYDPDTDDDTDDYTDDDIDDDTDDDTDDDMDDDIDNDTDDDNDDDTDDDMDDDIDNDTDDVDDITDDGAVALNPFRLFF